MKNYFSFLGIFSTLFISVMLFVFSSIAVANGGLCYCPVYSPCVCSDAGGQSGTSSAEIPDVSAPDAAVVGLPALRLDEREYAALVDSDLSDLRRRNALLDTSRSALEARIAILPQKIKDAEAALQNERTNAARGMASIPMSKSALSASAEEYLIRGTLIGGSATRAYFDGLFSSPLVTVRAKNQEMASIDWRTAVLRGARQPEIVFNEAVDVLASSLLRAPYNLVSNLIRTNELSRCSEQLGIENCAQYTVSSETFGRQEYFQDDFGVLLFGATDDNGNPLPYDIDTLSMDTAALLPIGAMLTTLRGPAALLDDFARAGKGFAEIYSRELATLKDVIRAELPTFGYATPEVSVRIIDDFTRASAAMNEVSKKLPEVVANSSKNIIALDGRIPGFFERTLTGEGADWILSLGKSVGVDTLESAIGSGIGDVFETTLRTASQPHKSGSIMTSVGHAFQKHASRNPGGRWGKISGSARHINEAGMKHFTEILESPGMFRRITTDEGLTFLEKRVPDGRGIRLNQDGSFKGFLDPQGVE